MKLRIKLHARTKLLLTTTLITCSVLAAASTPVSFNNHYYDTGAYNSVVADMNGDGHPDIVSASGSAVNILLNDGTGMFVNPGNNYAPTLFPGETELAICSVAVGDLNGDNLPDVAAADCGTGVIHIFYNNGSGGLTFAQDLAVGGTVSSVVIADLNGDGLNDVAGSADAVYVFYNQGGGVGNTTFHAPARVQVTSSNLSSLTSGDINADGLMDLAVMANAGSPGASVYTLVNQTTKGSTAPNFAITMVDSGTGDSVTLVDIDKDGHADLLIPFSKKSSCTTPCNSNGLTWIFNNPDGTRTKAGTLFNSPGDFFKGAGAATAGDFNNDGLNDLAFIVSPGRAEGRNQVRYLLATGRRTFSAVQPSETGATQDLHGLVAADLNGDHQVDLVTDALLRQTDTKIAILGDPGWGIGPSEYCAPPAPGVWHVCSPKVNQAYVGGSASVYFDGVATAPSGSKLLSTQVWIDNGLYDTSSDRGIIGIQNVGAGSHTIKFRAILPNGGTMDKTIAFTVGSSGCIAPTGGGVTICSPVAGTTNANPVNFSAKASPPSGQSVTAMKLYIDGVAKFATKSSTLTTSLTLSSGSHKVTVNAWTNTGLVEKASETITVN